MGAQHFHDGNSAENANDLQQRPCRENLIEQHHEIFRFLTPMTQLNSKLECLLPQRSFGTLRKL
jgi:hypothetical protein